MERHKIEDRRKARRYPLAFPVRYRVARREAPPLAGVGTTYDMSLAGIGFWCRQVLPLGAHIEVVVPWPARAQGSDPLELRMTGFVVRSDSRAAAVRVTSHKLSAETVEELQCAVSA